MVVPRIVGCSLAVFLRPISGLADFLVISMDEVEGFSEDM